jgi:hypothetical protein
MIIKKYYSPEMSSGASSNEGLDAQVNLAESKQIEVKKLYEEYLAFSQEFLFREAEESCMGRMNCFLYLPEDSGKSISLTRSRSKYGDENTIIEDQIESQDFTLKINFVFEINNKGELVSHPSSLDEVKNLINMYKSASEVDGNKIVFKVGRNGYFISQNGEWVKPQILS